MDSRLRRIAFDAWIEKTYRKFDDSGNDIGGFTTAEISRSMHRGYPADKILTDMMRAIHAISVFRRRTVWQWVSAGGHSGFTVCVQHLDERQRRLPTGVYVDTPRPESDPSRAAGFFRQSLGEPSSSKCSIRREGLREPNSFRSLEGVIPTAEELSRLGVSIFVGVGHETTRRQCLYQREICELLKWIDVIGQPACGFRCHLDARRHAVGTGNWSAVMAKCCLFIPSRRRSAGSRVISSLLHAACPDVIEKNQQDPCLGLSRAS